MRSPSPSATGSRHRRARAGRARRCGRRCAGLPRSDVEAPDAGPVGAHRHGQGGRADRRRGHRGREDRDLRRLRCRRRVVGGAASRASSAVRASTRSIYIPDRLFEGYGPERRGDEVARRRRRAAGGLRRLRLDQRRGARGRPRHSASTSSSSIITRSAPRCRRRRRSSTRTGRTIFPVSGISRRSGVTFLTVVAVNRRAPRNAAGTVPRGRSPICLRWLDLVALGTVCDVVPLVGLNRAFVAKGLLALARRENRGLAALADVARLGGPVGALSSRLRPRTAHQCRRADRRCGARRAAPRQRRSGRRRTDRRSNSTGSIRSARRSRRSMLEEAFAEADAEIGAGEGPGGADHGERALAPGRRRADRLAPQGPLPPAGDRDRVPAERHGHRLRPFDRRRRPRSCDPRSRRRGASSSRAAATRWRPD